MDHLQLQSTQAFQGARNAWKQQVEEASSVDQVLSITRDYLATFAPQHLARLPADCRPGRIKGEDDIAYWSCKLAQYQHKDPLVRVDAELMQEILNYFLRAWVRVSQLQRVVATEAAQVH